MVLTVRRVGGHLEENEETREAVCHLSTTKPSPLQTASVGNLSPPPHLSLLLLARALMVDLWSGTPSEVRPKATLFPLPPACWSGAGPESQRLGIVGDLENSLAPQFLLVGGGNAGLVESSF